MSLDIVADVFRYGSANNENKAAPGRTLSAGRGYIRVERAYDIAKLPSSADRMYPVCARYEVGEDPRRPK